MIWRGDSSREVSSRREGTAIEFASGKSLEIWSGGNPWGDCHLVRNNIFDGRRGSRDQQRNSNRRTARRGGVCPGRGHLEACSDESGHAGLRSIAYRGKQPRGAALVQSKHSTSRPFDRTRNPATTRQRCAIRAPPAPRSHFDFSSRSTRAHPRDHPGSGGRCGGHGVRRGRHDHS